MLAFKSIVRAQPLRSSTTTTVRRINQNHRHHNDRNYLSHLFHFLVLFVGALKLRHDLICWPVPAAFNADYFLSPFLFFLNWGDNHHSFSHHSGRLPDLGYVMVKRKIPSGLNPARMHGRGLYEDENVNEKNLPEGPQNLESLKNVLQYANSRVRELAAPEILRKRRKQARGRKTARQRAKEIFEGEPLEICERRKDPSAINEDTPLLYMPSDEQWRREELNRVKEQNEKEFRRVPKSQRGVPKINQTEILDFVFGRAQKNERIRDKIKNRLKLEGRKELVESRRQQRSIVEAENEKNAAKDARYSEQLKRSSMLVNDSVSGSLVRIVAESINVKGLITKRSTLPDQVIRHHLGIQGKNGDQDGSLIRFERLKQDGALKSRKKVGTRAKSEGRGKSRKFNCSLPTFTAVNGTKLKLSEELAKIIKPSFVERRKSGTTLKATDKLNERYLKLLAQPRSSQIIM